MTFALKITLATVALGALIALLASRLTVEFALVGNPTALAASSVEQALRKYESEHGHYPPLDFDLDKLTIARDGGPYLIGLPRDGWGRRFRYTRLNGEPKVYSAGPDGIFDTKDDIHAGG